MRIGIDVTWLKPSKSGGVESFFRNLLDGFLVLEDKNEYYLFLAKDNIESFLHYQKDNRIKCIECNTKANEVIKHLIWQNIYQWNLFEKYKVDLCYFPVYETPILKNKKLTSITTIHDIQAIHYPEYFPKSERIWYNIGWKATIKNSDLVVAISDFTKNDLIEHFSYKNKFKTIYNPIVLNNNEPIEFSILSEKYGIKKDDYYYTVCSMLKHKNLISLVNVIEKINNSNLNIPKKLVISGVSGPNKENFYNEIKEKGLENNVILTQFVSNEERNCLIQNSNVFLFPSLFEGFGMPPIEAMMLGSKVISSKKTSLYEVTKNKCVYVENPLDVDEWIKKIVQIQKEEKRIIEFPEYTKENIARQYLDTFYNVKRIKEVK